MEPVSIIAITSTAAKIIETCGSAVLNLREIKRRWKNAPESMDYIVLHCETIGATLKLMEIWLAERSEVLIHDDSFLESLLSVLRRSSDVLQELQQSTADFRKKNSLGWNRFKVLVDESSLRRSLDEVRWQAQIASNLWQAFSFASFERRQRVQQVRISQEVHDSQTTYAISSRASILIDDEVNGSENLGTFLARSIQFVEYVLHILSLIVLYFGLSLLVVFGGLILVNPIKSGTNTSLPTSPPPKPFFSGALLAAAVAGSWDQTSRLLEEGA